MNVIEKAITACEGSENAVSDHFSHVGKIVEAGIFQKDIGDIQLSRYACYLIVQNGDPRKKVIALGQSYFAVKTRQQKPMLFSTLPRRLAQIFTCNLQQSLTPRTYALG